MAIKYLAGERIIGTAAERAAMTTSASAGWTINETANAGNVAVTSGELVLNSLANASNNGSLAYYDLGGSVSSTAWVLRWEWYFTSFSGAGASPNTIDVGLSSGNDSAGSAGGAAGSWSPTENIAMVFMSGDGDDNYLQHVNATSATNVYGSAGGNISRTNLAQGISFSSIRYYMQLRRFSDSGTDTTEASYGTNSDYTTGRTTTTRTVNMPSSLRYLKAEIWHYNNNTSTTCYTKLDNIKFYNGVSVASTNDITYETSFSAINPYLPNGTIFEESDTGKHYMFDGTSTWNEVV